MRLQRHRVDTFDLNNDRRFRDLPDADKKWLVETLESSTPHLNDITSALQRSDLSSAQRSILVALRTSLVGNMRAEQGRAFTAEGAMSLTDVRARTLNAAQAPSGKTELQNRVETQLPLAMLGHEDQVPSFVEFARRYESPARQTWPLMAVVGREGQGKAEALDAFKTAVLGEEAEVVTIDLRDFGAGSPSMPGSTAVAALFGDKGLLSTGILKQRDPAYEPPPADPDDDPKEPLKPALIVLKGVEDLKTKNANVADGLAALIGTKRSMPSYANVMIVLDFDKPATEDPRKLVIDSLDKVGIRNLCATAKFDDLGGDELMSYADPIIKSSLAMPGIGNVVVEMDRDAEDALKRALATPHAPLEEMDQRLYEFIISKFDTQTNVNRDDAVLRVSLDPRFTNNPAALDRLIGQLHEEYADLSLGNQLFVVNVVARQVDSNADLEIALRHGKALGDQLDARAAQLAIGLPVVNEAAEEAAATVLGGLSQLGATVQHAMKIAEKHFALSREELLPPDLGAELDARIQGLWTALGALDTPGADSLPASWRVGVRSLGEQYAQAAQIISDTLQGIIQPPPPEPAEEVAE